MAGLRDLDNLNKKEAENKAAANKKLEEKRAIIVDNVLDQRADLNSSSVSNTGQDQTDPTSRSALSPVSESPSEPAKKQQAASIADISSESNVQAKQSETVIKADGKMIHIDRPLYNEKTGQVLGSPEPITEKECRFDKTFTPDEKEAVLGKINELLPLTLEKLARDYQAKGLRYDKEAGTLKYLDPTTNQERALTTDELNGKSGPLQGKGLGHAFAETFNQLAEDKDYNVRCIYTGPKPDTTARHTHQQAPAPTAQQEAVNTTGQMHDANMTPKPKMDEVVNVNNKQNENDNPSNKTNEAELKQETTPKTPSTPQVPTADPQPEQTSNLTNQMEPESQMVATADNIDSNSDEVVNQSNSEMNNQLPKETTPKTPQAPGNIMDELKQNEQFQNRHQEAEVSAIESMDTASPNLTTQANSGASAIRDNMSPFGYVSETELKASPVYNKLQAELNADSKENQATNNSLQEESRSTTVEQSVTNSLPEPKPSANNQDESDEDTDYKTEDVNSQNSSMTSSMTNPPANSTLMMTNSDDVRGIDNKLEAQNQSQLQAQQQQQNSNALSARI